MLVKETKVGSAGIYARYAAIDAQRRSTNNKSKFSAQQIRDAEAAKFVLEEFAYKRKAYLNYRVKFAVIKFDGKQAVDQRALKKLEAEYTALGWKKEYSENNVLYHSPCR
jgi:hypothetical protein